MFELTTGADALGLQSVAEMTQLNRRHRHASVRKNVCLITLNGSLNGLWLRVDRIPLDTSCQFRLGEQRFLFRVC